MSAGPTLAGLLAAADALRAGGAADEPWLSDLPLAGIGWATVEMERAAAELGEAFAEARRPAPDWAPAPREALLGANTWIAGGDDGRPPIVLLEPDTEGRLAATLARFGEGLAALYLEAVEGQIADPARLGRSSPGPLGPSRIVLDRPTWGPHLIVIERSIPDAGA